MNKRLRSLLAIGIAVILISSSSGCLEDFLKKLFGGDNEIERSEWAFEITQINKMNTLGFDGDNVVVGIVDTGIDPTHDDLDHLEIIAWRDFVNGRSEPYDDNGHGTHIAGIIAGKGKIDGVAPRVKLVVAKALDSEGRGNDDIVGRAIDFVVQNGADVICLSLGGDPSPLNLGDDSVEAANNAVDKGIFVVAAAGNDGPNNDDVSSPATAEMVIAVGAIDDDKSIADFSSRGDNDGKFPRIPNPPDNDRQDPNKKPEVVAPGVSIVSTYVHNSYATASGTSQSTAFVTGIIALLLDAKANYQHEYNKGEETVYDLKEILMDTSEKLDNQVQPHDDRYGYGLIQAYNAYVMM